MPYKSEAQRRAFHAKLKAGKMAKSLVDEFDRASIGLSLPERVRGRAKSLARMDRRHSRMRSATPSLMKPKSPRS
jgi:hypothetical protein